MRLAGEALAKRVEDPRRFEDRAGAKVRPEDLRRVSGDALHGQPPAGRPAARDHGMRRIAVAVLEADRHRRALGRRDQRLARAIQRPSGVFLVAGHDDVNVHPIELAGRFERLQRLDDDDVAALHVDDAGSARRVGVEPLELLERTVAFEDGVEMADQQDLLRAPGMDGHQMAGALPRGAVDPLCLEAERVELGAEDRADLPDAVEVLRAAVDVDDALEERDGILATGVDRRRDCAIAGSVRRVTTTGRARRTARHRRD